MMVATVGPADYNYDETISTLRSAPISMSLLVHGHEVSALAEWWV